MVDYIKVEQNGRSKSIQEQLRSDHITTIALLQEKTDENAVLKQKLTLLEKRLQALEDGIDGNDDKLDSGKMSVLDIAKLAEQNRKSSKEIDILKQQLQTVTNDGKQQLQSLQVKLTTEYSTQIKKLLSKDQERMDEIKGLGEKIQQFEEEQVNTAANSRKNQSAAVELENINELHQAKALEVDSLRLQLNDIQQKYSRLLQQYDEQVLEIDQLKNESLPSYQMQIEKLELIELISQQKIQDFESMIQKLQEKLQQQAVEMTTTMNKKIQNKEKECYKLSQEKDKLQIEIEKLLGTIQLLQQEQQKQTAQKKKKTSSSYNDSDNEEEEEELHNRQQPQQQQVVEEEDPYADKSSFRFQEFVRLKRENRELKMLLADKSYDRSASAAAAAVNGGGSSIGVASVLTSSRSSSGLGLSSTTSSLKAVLRGNSNNNNGLASSSSSGVQLPRLHR